MIIIFALLISYLYLMYKLNGIIDMYRRKETVHAEFAAILSLKHPVEFSEYIVCR